MWRRSCSLSTSTRRGRSGSLRSWWRRPLDSRRQSLSVAAMLAEGRTIRDIARATGREEETVRWHKKHVFSKVGVSRQVDLVRLLLSLGDIPRARR